MTTGKMHTTANLLLIPTVFASILSTTGDIPAAFFIATGIGIGIFIGPDLDIEETTYSEGILLRHVWLIGALFIALFYPYALLIQHRSSVSHMPVVSTAIRFIYVALILYAAAVLLVIMDVISHEQLASGFALIIKNIYLLYFFVGLCISDTIHWVMDTRIWKKASLR